MLKDIILKKMMKKENKKEGEMFKISLKGELDVKAYKKGKLIHHDKGNNTVTEWAKLAIIQSMMGKPFSRYGSSRGYGRYRVAFNGTEDDWSDIPSGSNLDWTTYWDSDVISPIPYWPNGSSNGGDGSLLSSSQFTNQDLPSWGLQQNSSITVDGIGTFNNNNFERYIFPYFPTKMLFGTQIETSGVSTSEGANNDDDGLPWVSEETDSSSNGSAKVDPISIIDTSIKGDIRAGIDENNDGLYDSQRPAFIYMTREGTFFNSDSEIHQRPDELYLDSDDAGFTTKMVFKTRMPAQDNSSIYYPYNGKLLKVAGLYNDALLTDNNEEFLSYESGSGTIDTNSMPYGMLLAKRYIAPIYKTYEVEIEFSWTIYVQITL